MATPFSTAIVIGASSGIGEAMVRKLVRDGIRVAAIARRKTELDRLVSECGEKVVPFVHDVSDFGGSAVLFDQIVKQFVQVDLLIYNAGVMPRVEESEYNFEKNRQMVEVNLLGAMAWMDPAAAYFEARRAGTLVGISSVAGDRGRRGNPGYHASKAGFSTYLESLRNRLTQHGVRVVTVKPGPVRTSMTDGLKLPLMISADECAEGALALARNSTNEGYVPAVWGPIMRVIQHIPSVIFRKMSF